MKKNVETCTTPFYTVSRLYKRKRKSNTEPSYKWIDEDRSFTLEEAEKHIDMIHGYYVGIKNYEPLDRFIIQKVENVKLIIYDED